MDIGQIPATVERLRAAFDSGRTRPLAWRTKQLDAIAALISENEEKLLAALADDLGKPSIEAFSAELSFVLNEVKHIRKHVAGWMKPERVSTPLVAQPGLSRIHKDPLGVVLIISPWNYPFQLLISPLVGAVAAGNCALLKPSEVAPATSAAIADLVPRYLDPDCVAVVEGAVPETTKVLEQRFDHIFYTGNGFVARIIMRAAAEFLTPVTLELGGKSPCIVDRDVDLDIAARRVTWGKFFNAGQTCVAPDYVLVHRDRHDALLEKMKATVAKFYGDDPKQSADYGRIVNTRHHQRICKLLEGATVAFGGEVDESARYISPTVLTDVSPDDPVMQDEIFGPVLPVLPYDSLDEAISFINARPKPLALYVFTGSEKTYQSVLERTSSGGAVVNHALIHLAVPDLPFGGVGESGMGMYHGRSSFDTFTHHKSVLRKPQAIDPSIMYPPYTASKRKWLRRLL